MSSIKAASHIHSVQRKCIIKLVFLSIVRDYVFQVEFYLDAGLSTVVNEAPLLRWGLGAALASRVGVVGDLETLS